MKILSGSMFIYKFAMSIYGLTQTELINKRRYVLFLYVKSVGNLSHCARDGRTVSTSYGVELFYPTTSQKVIRPPSHKGVA